MATPLNQQAEQPQAEIISLSPHALIKLVSRKGKNDQAPTIRIMCVFQGWTKFDMLSYLCAR